MITLIIINLKLIKVKANIVYLTDGNFEVVDIQVEAQSQTKKVCTGS